MSQSPTAADQTSAAAYFRNWDALGLMIARGSSFSGKERHCVFLNIGQERFADVSAATGLDFADDGRAVALTDWDHDGDVDLWLANRTAPRLRLLRNDLPGKGSFVSLRLQGRQSNRDAIGARVEVYLDGGDRPRRLIESSRAGSGFLTQSSKWLHFGVLPTERVTRVRVRWPGAEQWEEIAGITAGARYAVLQGSEKATTTGARRTDLALKSGTPEIAQPSSKTRVVFSSSVPMPRLQFDTFQGQRSAMGTADNEPQSPTLVNLWASWCQPCLQELGEFTAKFAAFEQAGVRVIALSTDGVTSSSAAETGSTIEVARQLVQQMNLPFESGIASAELLQVLSSLKSKILYKERPLPLPSSFLLDRRGRLAVLYTGPTSVPQILDDVKLLDASPELLDGEAFPGDGRFVFRNASVNPLAVADAFREGGYLEEAKAELQAALSRLEEGPAPVDEQTGSSLTRTKLDVYQRLAVVEMALQDHAAAVAAWKAALALDPTSAPLRLGLATAYGKLGDLNSAQAELDRVIQQAGEEPSVYMSVGTLWTQLGEPKRAVTFYQRGLKLAPDNRVLRFALASTLQASGAASAAIPHYRALAGTEDDQWSGRAANNLAWLFATHPDRKFRRGQEAVELARKACRLSNNSNPRYLGTLGAAYAEAGQFPQAIAVTKRAIDLATGDGGLVNSLQSRIELYGQQRPYHESR